MSLISRYLLNGNTKDSIGSSTASASGVTYVKGPLDRGASMNSATITIPIALKSTYSLSFWIRLKSSHTGAYRKFLECKGSGTDRSPGFWFHPYSNRVHLRQSVNGANGGADTTAELIIGQWHHLAFSCEVLPNNTTRLTSWLDGQRQHVSLNVGFPNYNDSDVVLLSGDYDIEDVRVYNHPLSAFEVVSLNRKILSQYRLGGSLGDVDGRGTMSIGSGVFIDSDRGTVVSLGNSEATISLNDLPLDLKGETITFWQRCGVDRTTVGGGGFANRIVQWGTYYGDNSGGFGIQSGSLYYYLRGPGASGWTSAGAVSSANGLYDQGGWIYYAVVFSTDNRFRVYMNGTLYVDIPLSVPFTGLSSEGLMFGTNMQADLSDVRIYRQELSSVEIQETHRQRAVVDSVGGLHAPNFIQKLKARYVRDWLNGSTANAGNHWLEVRAVRDGVNLSLNKPVSASHSGANLTKVSDGTTDNSGYAYVSATGGAWVQIDLGTVEEIDEVQVWHYNADRRTYYDTKTEVSEDGVVWIPIFDSQYEGTYPETSVGVKHAMSPRTVKSACRGLYLPDISEIGPSDGLMSWYPLNDTLSQRALGGDVYNFNASLDVNGVVFNGTNGYFSIPEVFKVTDINTFTVSLLVKPQSTGQILCPSSHGVDQFLKYDAATEAVSLYVTEFSDTNGRAYGSLPGTVPIGQWSLISFTIDNRDVALYVNGTYVAGVVNTGPIGTWYGRWDIGCRANGTQYFGGRVKDLRIYGKVLPPDQIGALDRFLRNATSLISASQSNALMNRQISEVSI